MVLFNIALIVHIVAIIIIAGTTFTGFFISQQFWACVQADKQRAVIINSNTALFGKLTGIGGMLTILSGIVMVISLHGAFVSQTWFRIKMILVLLIILNATFFARAQNKKLQILLLPDGDAAGQLISIRPKMNLYYAVQFIFLIVIFTLSVFKFN